MHLDWTKIRLDLKETFAIAHGRYDYREALLVRLSAYGETGFGECVGISYYGIDLKGFILELQRIKNHLERWSISSPEMFYQGLVALGLHPFLRSALDCAYWDLYGKLEGRSFSQLNGFTITELPYSSYTVSVAPVEEQLRKIRASRWPALKVKCDGARLDDVFRFLGEGKAIALDANTSFTAEDCVYLQSETRAEGFSYIEQPMPEGGYSVLKRDGRVCWMADEEVQDEGSLGVLEGHYAAVNVKLMKCGGLTPALALISAAKSKGYKVMVGCMTESSVGISAGAALAPLCDFADLDGANLIANDYARGSAVLDGEIRLSERPGLGISLL
ncbi:enolase C-terminal domain-like protein [Bergeyella sp. RCAD1439]|uniref:enolase C-terminal domain-like protein n=1 Tax=Bergeyella anatis TaxID=3113737 RepID=UPI002E19A9AD|nr:enolase C-terminal domain-like protein [Bergeyella sp. RCAD1439]